MKFTKEERHEIYKELLAKVKETIWYCYGDFSCWKLWVKLGHTEDEWWDCCHGSKGRITWSNYEEIQQEFPEFATALPNPKNGLSSEERIIMLKKCIELSKP